MRRANHQANGVGQAFRPVLRLLLAAMLFLTGQAWTPVPQAQQVVDRIIARVEGDILTLSELRELGAFQQLAGERPANNEQLLRQLIEQWIVNTEATAARFPRPQPEEVNRQLADLQKGFASAEAWRARLRELGLTESAVRRLVERQLYLSRYLDYKFRPLAQVDSAEVEAYYRDELVPRLTARIQTVPPLTEVEEQIREVLAQRQISERAARWLEESRQRTRIEIQPGATP